MNKHYNKYVNRVLRRLDCNSQYKKRIRSDLHMMLEDKAMELNETDPYKLLGEPEEVAEEFAENMGVKLFSKYEYVSEKSFLGMPLIQINNTRSAYLEYKSEKEIMGIPLVHINNKPFGVAKGIIAVGSVSIGVLSIGAISIGIISLGAISFALLIGIGGGVLSLIAGLGGVAIAGLFAFGGVAISNYISMGGVAIAKEFANGGYARAKVALGGKIHAHVGFYQQSGSGEYVQEILQDAEAMKNYIFNKAPNLDHIVKGFVNKSLEWIQKGYTHYN